MSQCEKVWLWFYTLRTFIIDTNKKNYDAIYLCINTYIILSKLQGNIII